MVYLAELLVVMTDRLNTVRMCARNVPRTRTQVLIYDDAFLASLSLSPQEATVSRADEPWRRLVETQKNRLQTTCACACLAVASKCRGVNLSPTL